MSDSHPKSRFNPLYILIAVVAAVVGFFLFQLVNNTQGIDQPEAVNQAGADVVKPLPVLRSSGPAPSIELLGSKRPDFTLPDVNGKSVSASQWDGDVLLINFWATWCPPCIREMPAFVEVREKYKDKGFEIVGIAMDDPQAVIDFTDSLGVEYALLIGEDSAVELAKQLGNRYGVLPYSVLLDREGKIRYIRPGELTGDVLESELKKLL